MSRMGLWEARQEYHSQPSDNPNINNTFSLENNTDTSNMDPRQRIFNSSKLESFSVDRGSLPYFPTHGILPKHETNALSFINGTSENVNPDGRGTVIAILDTGVDPGAAGLSVTTEGETKIIDIIDCTGSGDIPLNIKGVQPKLDDNGNPTIVGISGQTLILNKDWVPRNNEGFSLGLKYSGDLFPKPLVDRLNIIRKKNMDKDVDSIFTDLEKDKNQILEKIKIVETELKAIENKSSNNNKANDDLKIKLNNLQLDLEDSKMRVKLLTEIWEKTEYPGSLIDVIVFHDGVKWRAVVDTKGDGDLRKQPALTNYHDEKQYSQFDDETLLNYSVNIYDEGKTLSLVTVAGSHGTHVAAITAANHGENSELNGVAPGAKIISLKIGDTRLGSMETGTGLVRAAIELARLKPDLANMSYGEASSVNDYGRFAELLRDEVIGKGGTVFVSSAGNAGPALSTVGAPGGTTTGVISVGAYVTNSMMDAEYAMIDNVSDNIYTWCSRGPSTDGAVGVDVYAPGAAVTSVPQYTVQRTQLMNGTSMSSPNLCGCLALVISKLKISKVSYNPYIIRTALQYTGKNVTVDPFGINFVQVNEVYDYIESHSQDLTSQLQYDINVSYSNGNSGRGVYLRNPNETNDTQLINCEVKPRFMNSENPELNAIKQALDIQVILTPSAKWISCPKFAMINNNGRSFSVKVSPQSLSSGLYSEYIYGYDSSKPISVGPLFRIPITVCKPEVIQNSDSFYDWKELKFYPGTVNRKFIAVPLGATRATINIKSVDREVPARLYAHLLQLQPRTRYPRHEHAYAFSLSSQGATTIDGKPSDIDKNSYSKTFTVIPNCTLEICLAQFWSSPDLTNLDVEIKFFGLWIDSNQSAISGLLTNSSQINLAPGGFTRIDSQALLRKQILSPTISLTTVRKEIAPSDVDINPLLSRDVLPDNRQLYELIVTYNLKIDGDAEFTPRFSLANDVLYDSALHSFVLIAFDSNKRVLSYQDVYAKSINLKSINDKFSFASLSGKNTSNPQQLTIKIQLVGINLQFVENLSKGKNNGLLNLIIDRKLSKPITVPLFSSLGNAISNDTSNGSFKRAILNPGERAVFFSGNIDIPSTLLTGSNGNVPIICPGNQLIGTLNPISDKVDGLGPIEVSYSIGPKPVSTPTTSKPTTSDEKSAIINLKSAERNLAISWFDKLKTKSEVEELSNEIEKKFKEIEISDINLLNDNGKDEKLSFLVNKLVTLFKIANESKKLEDFDLVKEITDSIFDKIDQKKLYEYLGKETLKSTTQAKQGSGWWEPTDNNDLLLKTEKDLETLYNSQREALRLSQFARTYIEKSKYLKAIEDKDESLAKTSLESFDKEFEILQQWLTREDSKLSYLKVWRLIVPHGNENRIHWGLALQILRNTKWTSIATTNENPSENKTLLNNVEEESEKELRKIIDSHVGGPFKDLVRIAGKLMKPNEYAGF